MTDQISAVLPLDVLDGIWPTGVNLRARRERTSDEWIDVLEREVDRGLLRRVGDGTDESPFRYEEVAAGAFTLPPTWVGLDHPTTSRLLSRLGIERDDT
jgi:hypothetical protein